MSTDANKISQNIRLGVKLIGALPLVAEIILFGLGGLAVLVQIFHLSIAIGLVLILFGGLGAYLAFAGAVVAGMGFGLSVVFEDVENGYEYWAKLIGSYIGVLLLSYGVYLLGNWLLSSLAVWLYGFIR